MREEELLSVLKEKIEKQFCHGEYHSWVNSDYIKLSEEITEKTKIYLSPITLKRIFGKVDYTGRPQVHTMDALAIYVDCKSWKTFSEDLQHEKQEVKTSAETQNATKKKIKTTYVFIFILLALAIVFIVLKKNQKDNVLIFSYQGIAKLAPHNAVINFDISKVDGENCKIDYDDHFVKDSGKVSVLKDKNVHMVTHTYKFGNVYHPKLYIDDKIVSTTNVPVLTKGWEFVLVNYNVKEDLNFIPVFSEKVKQTGGALFVPLRVVKDYGMDTMSSYFVKYRYVHDFKVGFDDFSCEIKARNVLQKTNVCPEISVFILGLKASIRFKIFRPGCGGKWTIVEMGQKKLNGEFHDLSAFGHELDKWRIIKVEVHENVAKIFIDGKIIYQSKIEGELGGFYGMVLDSQGSAEFDYIRIADRDRPIFAQEFD
ncbi:MAG: hypothetical protein NT150_02345 [Bacteroidetes bacterium]|nr:hypothetical protein [Bacteroidota bacterium]